MDLVLLESELRSFLDEVQHGDFFDRFNIAQEQRVIKDIAISGNGEPTSLKNFDQAIRLIGDIALDAGVLPRSKFVLISNGSLIHQKSTQAGLTELTRYHGELWFKLDSATLQGRRLLNNTELSPQKLIENLKIATSFCPTRLQTCMLRYQTAWSDDEKQAYLDLLKTLGTTGIKIEGIMLYSLARPSHQPEASELERMAQAEMDAFAADIKALGYDVSVNC